MDSKYNNKNENQIDTFYLLQIYGRIDNKRGQPPCIDMPDESYLLLDKTIGYETYSENFISNIWNVFLHYY